MRWNTTVGIGIASTVTHLWKHTVLLKNKIIILDTERFKKMHKSPCDHLNCKLAKMDKMNQYCLECKVRLQYIDLIDGKIEHITARPPDINEHLISLTRVNQYGSIGDFISKADLKIKNLTNFESYSDLIEHLYCEIGYDINMIKHSIFNYLGRGFVNKKAIFKIIQDRKLEKGTLQKKRNAIRLKVKNFC